MSLADFRLVEDGAAEEDLRALLRRFNENAAAYPRDRTVHAVFAEAARRSPGAVAAVQGDRTITYGDLDLSSNRVARLLVDQGLAPEDLVGVLFDDAVGLLTALLGILKAGCAYCPLDVDTPYERARLLLRDAGAHALVSERRFMRRLNRLHWDCERLETILVLDSADALAEPEDLGEKMKREVWDYVGQTMFDDISGGGWQSSFTGEWLSREVMDDYGENARAKIAPLLSPEMRVLEIGCSSGISMFRLAPLVREYVGTDLSPEILRWTRAEAERRGAKNIRLEAMAADEIDRLAPGGGFDVVVLNSVLQCFSGHNYLRDVVRKAVALMKDRGVLFLGNVFDQDLKDAFLDELHAYRRSHAHARTKTDYSEELFINRAFLEDLRHDLPEVAAVETSLLVGTHESELSRFSFDAILRIDKTGASAAPRRPRAKRLLDRRAVEAASDAPIPERTGPRGLAYVIFTSGTSGRPKGVLVEHRSILRLVVRPSYVDLDDSVRVLMTGALAFDASTFEVWGALLNGGTLVRPAAETALLDAAEVGRLIRAHGITTMWLTATLFNQLAEADAGIFAPLRHLLVGGEKLSPHHVNLVRRAHPGLVLVNGYGPTENTTFTICHRIDRCCDGDVPLGRPISGTEVLILDPGGRMVPPGIPGEISAGGDGLARGYLNDEALTAEKFVAHPLAPGERIYRTGDRGRWTPEGLVEFLGRVDEQVKIRGYRIEPAEIEHRIRESEGVTDAVVLALVLDGEKTLVAYVTGPAEAEAVRADLKAKLPDYMVPACIVRMERFPLSPNGKVDRKALPRPDRGAGAAGGRAPLEGEAERALAEIFEEILGAHGVGATDDFFDLGGHSLKVTKLVAAIQRRLGVSVPLAAVFRAPTVRGLAAALLDAARFGVPLADEAMVLLGGSPGDPPVFALPPGTGDVLGYMPLAARLPGVRLYAFNWIEAESRIEAYAGLVAQTDPEGPILLLGQSSGGNLAAGVAAALERRGRRVSDVVMIDSGRRLAPYPYVEAEVLRAAEVFLAHESVRPYASTPVLREKVIRRIVGCYRWLSRGVDDAVLDARIHVILQDPPAMEARHEGRLVSSIPAWAETARGGLETYAGAGDHGHMLMDPAVCKNAEIVRRILEAALAGRHPAC